MPWTNSSCPHYVLEINSKCNISCRGCYKKLDGHNKPLGRILSDLDIALSLRKIHTVSIAGGEPLLHPELRQIIKTLHRRKIKVALITNGLILDDDFLIDLKNSGLDIIMFHIDEGQKRPDLSERPTVEEVNSLRTKLTEKAVAKGIDTGLSVTVYPEYLKRVPLLVDYILKSKQINYLFATNYVDIENIVKANHSIKHKPGTPSLSSSLTTNQQMIEILKNNFGLEPFTFLKSSRVRNNRLKNPYWVNYFIPIMYYRNKNKIFYIRSNWADSALITAYYLINGKFKYYCDHDFFITAFQVIWNAIFTGRARECLRFLSKFRHKNALLREKHFIFENGPSLSSTSNIECGAFCPNATMKNGKLTHICTADFVNIE